MKTRNTIIRTATNGDGSFPSPTIAMELKALGTPVATGPTRTGLPIPIRTATISRFTLHER